MKKLVLTMVLCMAALVACQEAPKAPKVGVVDPNEVYTKSKAATEASQYLQSMSKSLQAEVMQAQKDMQDDKLDQKGKDEISKRFQEKLQQYQSTVGQEQGRIVAILNDAFAKAVETYRAKNNYALILTKESAIAMGPEADVTAGVVEAMNAMDIKWQAEEKKAEPAAAPEAAPAAAGEDKKAEAPKAEPKDDKAAAKPAAAPAKDEKKDEKKP
jgi:outer membrane protein